MVKSKVCQNITGPFMLLWSDPIMSLLSDSNNQIKEKFLVDVILHFPLNNQNDFDLAEFRCQMLYLTLSSAKARAVLQLHEYKEEWQRQMLSNKKLHKATDWTKEHKQFSFGTRLFHIVHKEREHQTAELPVVSTKPSVLSNIKDLKALVVLH